MIDTLDILRNIKNIYASDNVVSSLVNMEKVLDDVNIYAYQNWNKGELVEWTNVDEVRKAYCKISFSIFHQKKCTFFCGWNEIEIPSKIEPPLKKRLAMCSKTFHSFQ